MMGNGSYKSNRLSVKILLFALAAVMLLSAVTALVRRDRLVNAAEQTGMITGKEIYSENFDDIDDGALPEGWTLNPDLKNGGSARVENGELVINSTGVEFGKVLLPPALSEYGNYTFEADVTFESSVNESRWMSLIIRQQENDQDYYHMCVRRNTTASNGVEFAVRSPGNWNVMNTAPAKTKLGLNKQVHIKISAVDGIVYEYVDNKLIIETDSLASLRSYFKTGGLGIQANFSVIRVDNVKVSECTYVVDPDKVVDEKYMSHNFLVTPVISAAATIAIADSIETIDRLTSLTQKPESVILYVDDAGNVVSPDGNTTIGALSEVTDKVFRKMLPVFYFRTEAGMTELSSYIKSSKLSDCMAMTDDPELMTQFRKRNIKISGAIDYTGALAGKETLSQAELDEIIYKTNEHSAKTALIPEKLATKANVEYMQYRLITVWAAESAEAGDNVMLHNSIQSGANGIVTDTPEELIDAYSFYRPDPAVLVRNPMVIGHRGLPSSAPENTLESARDAIAAGVDCIELDVRLSSDGKLYIYHDGDLSSLTNGKGTVNSHTSKELDSYRVLKSGSYGTFAKYPKVKLPSLDDYFAALKDEDVMFFIEIKEEGLEEKVAEMVDKYGLKNRCCMISFVTSAVTGFPKAEPGMSVGQLMGTPDGSSYETKVKSLISTVVPENATFNASGVNDTKMVRALMYRGITAWPWTYNNGNTRDAYLLGVGGITTDFCNSVSDVPVRIDIGSSYSFTLNPNEKGKNELTFYPAVYNRLGLIDVDNSKYVTHPEIVILEGAEHVKVEGNTLTAISDGTVRFMYRLMASTDPNKQPDDIAMDSFVLYTQVVTVSIDSGAEVDPDTLPTPTPVPSRSGSERSLTKIIIISVACVAVIGICCILLAISGKKKQSGQQDRTDTGEQ